jgi:hypothetical protein
MFSHVYQFPYSMNVGLLEIGQSSMQQAKTSVLKEWVSIYEMTRKVNYDQIM